MRVAEGKADVYISPNLGRVRIWDTCAPHAVIAAAGGIVKCLDGTQIKYGSKENSQLSQYYFAILDPRLEIPIIRAAVNAGIKRAA